jgi:hypothetical protein
MSLRSLITCVLLISASNMTSTHAQGRMSDADLEKLLRSLRDHSKSFRQLFDNALKRSTISRTSRGKSAQQAADSLERGTESLLNDFTRIRRGEDKLRSVQRSAHQIHTFVNTYRPGRQIAARWGRIETELQEVRAAYAARGSTVKENAGAKSAHAARSGSASCLDEIGEERAARIVDQCLEVSPATHPPCNSQNPCALIVNEIRRSCALNGTRGAPPFCKEYR